MNLPHKKYEFVLEENKVYQIRPVSFTNAPRQISITGTGSVNIKTSIDKPNSADDPILIVSENDADISAGVWPADNTTPNFIKIEENSAGERIIILCGFDEPQELEFI